MMETGADWYLNCTVHKILNLSCTFLQILNLSCTSIKPERDLNAEYRYATAYGYLSSP